MRHTQKKTNKYSRLISENANVRGVQNNADSKDKWRHSITNPELDKHRKIVLGEPGSKLWNEYYDGLILTKYLFFGEDSIRQYVENSRKTLKNRKSTRTRIGGGPNTGGSEENAKWLIALFETDEMDKYQKYCMREFNWLWMFVDNNTNNHTQITFNDFYKNNKNKIQFSSEHVKIFLIPFFLKIYLELVEKLKETKIQNNNNDESDLLRKYILITIDLLRNMNMYANPVFFDDLYYYYYYLGIDNIFPFKNIDEWFRNSSKSSSALTPSPKVGVSKINFKLRAYEQFPKDDPENNKHYFGFDILEEYLGKDSSTDFDLFLNLVKLHPDYYYNIPVTAEVEAEFNVDELETNDKINLSKIKNITNRRK